MLPARTVKVTKYYERKKINFIYSIRFGFKSFRLFSIGFQHFWTSFRNSSESFPSLAFGSIFPFDEIFHTMCSFFVVNYRFSLKSFFVIKLAIKIKR